MRPFLKSHLKRSAGIGMNCTNSKLKAQILLQHTFFKPSYLKQQLPIRCTLPVLNKSYLTLHLTNFPWTYALPEFIVGGYVKMFCGLFMKNGSLKPLLHLFSLVKTWDLNPSQYKLLEPSFAVPLGSAEQSVSLQVCKGQHVSYGFSNNECPKIVTNTLSVGTLERNLQPSFLSNFLFKEGYKIEPLLNFQQPRMAPIPLRLMGVKKFKVNATGRFERRLYALPLLAFRSNLICHSSAHMRGKITPSVKTKLTLGRLGHSSDKFKFENLADTAPLALPQHKTLLFWNLLYQQPLLNYSLKYCRLSRRVRKILKNKYRYSKYFFMIAPYKRRLYTLHLWKYILKFHDERTFGLKFKSFLLNFSNPDLENLLWSLFYIQQRLALKKLLGR